MSNYFSGKYPRKLKRELRVDVGGILPVRPSLWQEVSVPSCEL